MPPTETPTGTAGIVPLPPTSLARGGGGTPEGIAAGYLLGYGNPHTRNAYARDLRQYAAWCAQVGVGILEVERGHLEAWARTLEAEGRSPATVARKLAAVAGMYGYAALEGYLPRNPAAHIRRPRVGDDSPTLGLSKEEAQRFLEAAESAGPRDHALAALLLYSGLRVSEVCGAEVEDLGTERGHRVLTVTRKRGKRERVPLAPPTLAALSEYLGDRTSGPLLRDNGGEALDRHDAARIVRRLAHSAGIDKAISPHSLRHTAVTLALDAGVPLRDVQDFVGHADPRTTRRYDRARQSLDRHATYSLASFLAS